MIVEYLKFRNPETNEKIDWRHVYINRLPENPLVVEISDFSKTWQLPLIGIIDGIPFNNDIGNPKFKEFDSEEELYQIYETFYYEHQGRHVREWNKWIEMYKGYPLLKGSACIGTKSGEAFIVINYRDLLDRNYESLKWYLIDDYLI